MKDDELVQAAQAAVGRLNEALRDGGRYGRWMKVDPASYLELRKQARAKAQEEKRTWLLVFPLRSQTLVCVAEKLRGAFIFEVFAANGTSVFPRWRSVGSVLDYGVLP